MQCSLSHGGWLTEDGKIGSSSRWMIFLVILVKGGWHPPPSLEKLPTACHYICFLEKGNECNRESNNHLNWLWLGRKLDTWRTIQMSPSLCLCLFETRRISISWWLTSAALSLTLSAASSPMRTRVQVTTITTGLNICGIASAPVRF